jgi:hypothetical protein
MPRKTTATIQTASLDPEMGSIEVIAPEDPTEAGGIPNRLIRGVQAIDRAFDPINQNSFRFGGRYGSKLTGVVFAFAGLYHLDKLDKASDPIARASVEMMALGSTLGGLLLIAVGMENSQFRTHFEQRRTPAEVYRQKRMRSLDSSIANIGYEETDINNRLTSAVADYRVNNHPAVIAKYRKKSERRLDEAKNTAEIALPQLADERTRLQTKRDAHKAKSDLKTPATVLIRAA